MDYKLFLAVLYSFSLCVMVKIGLVYENTRAYVLVIPCTWQLVWFSGIFHYCWLCLDLVS